VKKVLVVHPYMSAYAGGEILCLYACKAMQELGYHVYLYCDEYDLEQVKKRWGQTAYDTMAMCEWIEPKPFKPRFQFFRAYQFAIHELMRNGLLRESRRQSEFVLSTQGLYIDPELYNFCLVYDLRSPIFGLMGFLEIPNNTRFYPRPPHTKLRRMYLMPLRKIYNNINKFNDASQNRTMFIPESKSIDRHLRKVGLRSAGFVQAPCQPSFKIGKKRKYVVQVTRLNPHKRPHDFAEVARRLPEYEFVLVYMITDLERPIWPDYEKEFLKAAPSNLKAVNELILRCPEYMEEAKVYLYTGREPGATTSLGQAALAGCIPVSSSPGGGADQVEDLGYGYTYGSIDEAVEKTRLALESDVSPFQVAENAKIFLPETFMETLKKIVF